jgi:branched-chain amino acid transport system permease protein
MSGASIEARVRNSLYGARRWHPAEIVFWVLALAAFFLLPRQLLILNEIAILGMFALSLDLILGYAGIVSLGHAAFFGFGAYAAGLLRQARQRRSADGPRRRDGCGRRCSAS